MKTWTDAGANEWLIVDAPTHLRVWGSRTTYPLPFVNAAVAGGKVGVNDEWIIGAANGCWLQLQDAIGRVSKRHARLDYDRVRRIWTISDLQSKSGVTQDGARQPSSFPVTPGVEIGVGGGFVLIAESPLLRALRELLARFIGWTDDRALDLALRSARWAVTHREPLQLCGDDDLTSIAQLLHHHTLGGARPFVTCARPRLRAPRSGRELADYDSGMPALAAAYGGTLCISHRHPHDFAQVVKACHDAPSRVQLIVCMRRPEPSDRRTTAPIIVPSLKARASELHRVIDAYAGDVGAGALPGGALTAADREWVRDHESKSLAKIQEATRRLVAIRSINNVTQAAAQLGLSHSALSEWVARRTLDIDDEDSDDDHDE
jgi:hypothetical protein